MSDIHGMRDAPAVRRQLVTLAELMRQALDQLSRDPVTRKQPYTLELRQCLGRLKAAIPETAAQDLWPAVQLVRDMEGRLREYSVEGIEVIAGSVTTILHTVFAEDRGAN